MATSLYMEHLSAQELQSLTEYKNRGEDHSLTYKYIMGPFYSRLIHLVPMWIAPNTVTFIGFLLTISGHILLMYHVPRFDSEAPSWVYLYAGMALFVYMVLDNLDGKQARRTQSSSPLGHLFDHGCDALNVTLSGMSQLATIRLGPGWMSMTLLSSLGQLMLFSATLEEYFTGAMILREFNGPNEGLITMCMLQVLTGIFGPSIWTTDVPLVRGVTMKVNQIVYCACLVPAVNAVVGNGFGIWKFLRSERNGVWQTMKCMVAHTMPVVTFWLCFNGWAFLAPVSFSNQLLYILWMSGLLMFDLISRMILAHLAKAPYPFVPLLFIPVLLCSCNAILEAQFGISVANVEKTTFVTLGMLLLYNLWRIWCLITQLCMFLNVRCFSLKKLQKGSSQKNL